MDEIFIYGDIGFEVDARSIADAITAAAGKPITLRISSAGGSVFEGFTIANLIQAHDAPVTAVVDGVAASMATIIALAADRVEMASDAWWMIHNPSAFVAGGESDDLRRQAELMDSMRDQMRSIYQAKTGAELSQIVAWMDAETWFNADAALAAGFVDEVSNPRMALVAHAGFLRLDRFEHPPNLSGGSKVKPKLVIAICARISAIAADETARKSILDQIVALSDFDSAALDLFLSGVSQIKPTDSLIEACASILGLEVASLREEAAANWPEFAATPAPEPGAQAAGPNVTALAVEEGKAAERKRMLDIRAMYESHPGFEAQRDEAIQNGMTVDQAAQHLLAALGNNVQPVGQGVPAGGGFRVTQDRKDKFRAGAQIAIMARADFEFLKEHRDELDRNEFAGMSLAELARHSCEIAGLSLTGLSRLEIIGQSFTTSDFPNILADVAHKSMMNGFEESAETWSMWAQIGNLQDFKPHKRTALSEFGDMQLITNGSEEYKRGEFKDLGEDIKLETYGRLFSITRQSIINDDQNAFTAIPRGMGRAYGRKVGTDAYAVLIAGQVSSETGNNTYDAAHNNSATAALDTASLVAARVAMATQKGPLRQETSGDANKDDEGAIALNIRPAYLVVPVALEDRAISIIQAQYEFDDAAKGSVRPNPVRNLATPVADARMDATSATQWILTAAPSQHPTIEVGFLDGRAEPRLEQQDQFTTDGVDFKVSGDHGVRVLDWRGLYKSDGTT